MTADGKQHVTKIEAVTGGPPSLLVSCSCQTWLRRITMGVDRHLGETIANESDLAAAARVAAAWHRLNSRT